MRKLYTPKKIIFSLALILFCFIVKKTVSYAAQPPVGYTGAPSESNCTSCHTGGGINNGAYNSSIRLLTNMPFNHYAANTTYHMTVRLATHNCIRFGFQTTVLSSTNLPLGTLTVTDNTRTQKLTSGSRQYIEQTYAGATAQYTDSTDWNFDWTSPLSNAGVVTFYLAANVTNNDNNYTNDTIYAKSFQFPFSTPPTASINTSANSICEGDSVKFTASGSNSPTGWNWTFPNGIPSSSTLQVQWVKFPNTGVSTCSLYVSNSSGNSNIVSRVITTNTFPTSVITSNGNTTFCQGDSVSLTGTQGAGFSYSWLLGGVPTGLTSSSIYAKAGGTYTLKITGPGNCSVISSSLVVTVNPRPIPVLSFSGNLNFCTGDSVLLALSGSQGSIIEWYKGTTLLGTTDTFYYAKTTGVYSVRLTNSLNCSTTSNSLSIVVNTYPTASFTSTPTGCIFILTANSGTGYIYQWFKNDTLILNDTTINHTLNANGTYKVRVTNPGGCSAFSSSQSMNVTNLPDVSMTITGSPIFCIGDSVKLAVPQKASYSYRWFKNGNPLPNDTLPSISVKDSGDYLVKVSDITCTNISNTVPVKVLTLPDATITPGNTSFCLGDSALINANTAPVYTYKWYRNDTVITGETKSVLVVRNSGNYNAIVSNGYCERGGNKVSITANPLPAIPVITRNQHTLNTSAAIAYQWFKDGVLISGANAQSYSTIIPGKYKVMITDANGCKNTSSEFDYSLAGINSLNKEIPVRIYPVPADQSITIEAGSDNSVRLEIFDGCGKNIYNEIASGPKTMIDLSSWSEGIYVLFIEEGGNSKKMKFVIER